MLEQEREEELKALEQYRKGLEPPPILYRADGMKVDTKPGEAMVFVASEESEDRQGDIITIGGWQLDNFNKNPVFLYMHNPHLPPIGSWAKVWPDKMQLLASPKWDEEDEFAKLIKGKYERGFMRAVSVGFRVHEFEERLNEFGESGMLFKKQELLEISAVPVPAHARSLKRALGARSYYWIPFQVDGEHHLSERRKALIALKDELADVLEALMHKEVPTSDNNVLPETSLDWDQVLITINDMVAGKGGFNE